MSTLTSASTLAQIEAAYDDNASWFEDKSVAKAKAFVTATRMLLRRIYSGQTKGANSLSFRIDLLQKELDEAMDFVRKHDSTFLTGPRVTQASFFNFRGYGPSGDGTGE